MVKSTTTHGPMHNIPPEENDLYRALFESSGVATVIADENGTISLVNQIFIDLTGYKRKELEGKKKWSELVVNSDLTKMGQYNELTGSNPGSFMKTFEFKLAGKEKELKDVYISKGPIKGSKSIALSFVDITDLIKAGEQTRALEEKYRSLIESTDDSIYMVDRDCRYLFVNGRVLARLGVTEEDLVGKRYGDFHDLNDTREFGGYLEKVFETASSYSYEHRNPNVERIMLRTLSPIMEQNSQNVKYAAVISKDITDLKKTEEKLKYLSLHDPLTSLYNRAYFEEEMRRHDSDRFELVGLIMCDIDGLKLINDTLGHDKGDELLGIASQVIKQSFRESDVVARVGGDEFAILLPNSPRSKVEEIRERIRHSIIEYNKNNPLLPLSVATGFAIRTDPGQSMADLYREADNQMYKEKLYSSQAARNTIVKNIVQTIETNGFMTKQSMENLQKLAVELGSAVGLSEERLKDLYLLARFHDIGNVGIYDRVLHKQGRLSNDDIVEIHKHCNIGYRIAQSAPDLVHIADYILKHHEWWNGRGYPLGISGKDIPIESRIMAIADAYEAMVGTRPYRKTMTKDQALEELKRYAGSQFDPNLVETFINIQKAQ